MTQDSDFPNTCLNKIRDSLDKDDVNKANELLKELNSMDAEMSLKQSMTLKFLHIKKDYITGDYERALENSLNLIEKVKEQEFYQLLINIYKERVRIFLRVGIYEAYLEEILKLETLLDRYKRVFTPQFYKSNILFAKNCKGLYYWHKNDLDRALSIFEECISFGANLSDKSYLSRIFNNMGLIYYDKSDFENALQYYKKSLEGLPKNTKTLTSSRCLNNIGLVYKNLGDYDKALDYFKRAYQIRQAIGNEKEAVGVLDNIAEIYLLLGDYESALKIFNECYAVLESKGNKEELSINYAQLGRTYFKLGQSVQALDYFNLSLQYSRELGQKLTMAETLINVAGIYTEQGEYQLALECLRQSIGYFKRTGNRVRFGEAYFQRGKIYFEMNLHDSAEDDYLASLSLFKEIGNEQQIAKVLYSLISLYIVQEQQIKAKECLDNLRSISVQHKENKEMYYYWLLAGASYSKKFDKRLASKIESQKIFEKVSKNKNVNLILRIFAIINVIDCLFYEYELTGNKLVLEEIKEKAQELVHIAEFQNSPKLLIQAYIISAKVSVSVFEFKKAYILLDQALNIAQSKELAVLKVIVEDELFHLEELKEKHEVKEIKEKNNKSKISFANMNNLFFESMEHLKQVQSNKNEHTDPINFSLIAYKWDDLGFLPFSEHLKMDFPTLIKDRYGTFVSIATSLGSEYHSGLYGPFPFSLKDYESIVYSEIIKEDASLIDERLKEANYLLLAIIYPKKAEKIFFVLRDKISDICSKSIHSQTSVNDINSQKLGQISSEIQACLDDALKNL